MRKIILTILLLALVTPVWSATELDYMEYSSDSNAQAAYPGNDTVNFQCYSEATIKTQGSYALKCVALQTGSLNDVLIRMVSPTVDLSGLNQIKFDIRASRTGENITIIIYDDSDNTIDITPNITNANQWQTVSWDISAVSDANKDAMYAIVIMVANADADNTFYLDNMYGGDILTLLPSGQIILII